MPIAVLLVAACGGGGESSVIVEGECPDGLHAAIERWHAAGFDGVLVVDRPDGAGCSLAAGTIAPGVDEAISQDSVFAIGSVSKAFTAVAVLALEANGSIDRSRSVSSFVPRITGPAGAATIGELLAHTSGIVGSVGEDGVALGRDDAIERFNGLVVDEAERGRFLYSNAGYSLLALVVEAVSGGDYRDFLVDRLLPEGAGFWDGQPAAIGDRVVGVVDGVAAEDLGGAPGPQWATQGNGDLAMSPVALATWTRDVFTGGVIPPAAVQRMLDPAVEADGQAVTDGWGRLPADVLGEVAIAAAGAGGTGQNVVAVWLPESERVIVVASSSDGLEAESLLQLIGPALVSGGAIPDPDVEVDVDESQLDEVVGGYALPTGGRIEVARADGASDRLAISPVGADAVEALRVTDALSAEEVAEHEQALTELLAGRTEAGRAELAALADDYGALTDVELLGTTVEDGETRTYAQLRFGDRQLSGSYALDRAGGIEAVDLGGPPRFELVAVRGGFRVDGTGPIGDPVGVTFDGDVMSMNRGDGIALDALKVDP